MLYPAAARAEIVPNWNMAEDAVVTTQPRANRKEVEEFVRDIDPIEVLGK